MADIMKKCWSHDPVLRPRARDLDSIFTDYRIQDCEPVSSEQQSVRTTVDMLYEIFPKHIADSLKTGQKVEPEQQ